MVVFFLFSQCVGLALNWKDNFEKYFFFFFAACHAVTSHARRETWRHVTSTYVDRATGLKLAEVIALMTVRTIASCLLFEIVCMNYVYKLEKAKLVCRTRTNSLAESFHGIRLFIRFLVLVAGDGELELSPSTKKQTLAKCRRTQHVFHRLEPIKEPRKVRQNNICAILMTATDWAALNWFTDKGATRFFVRAIQVLRRYARTSK